MHRTRGALVTFVAMMMISLATAGSPASPQGGKNAPAFPDRDRDGILDSLDHCPHEPEIVNFYQDSDGCPDTRPDPVRNGPIPGLSFASGMDVPESTLAVLDSLSKILEFYPGTRLELRGHTDNVEGPDPMELALNRARFVKTYLVNLGVAPERLEAKGVGAGQPLQPNRTGAARMLNRRVEVYAH